METENIKLKPGIIEIIDIQKLVEYHFNMVEFETNRRSRKTEIRLPRQIAHYCCCYFKYNFNWSLYEIGINIGGTDHATVLHSKRTVQNLIDTKYKYALLPISEHIEYLINKIYGLYRTKKQKTTLGTGTQSIRPTTGPPNNNEILPVASLESISQRVHCGQPTLRRMLEKWNNNHCNGGGSYKTNKSVGSIRHAKREIWRTIKRNKCAITM